MPYRPLRARAKQPTTGLISIEFNLRIYMYENVINRKMEGFA